MFRFDVTRWVPRFILNDKNGYAIAKAIEVAMKTLNNTCKTGVNNVASIDDMPEWRLDEMAWELDCLYNYNSDIEKKRNWIRNAIPYYRLYGTPKAVETYIGGYFDSVELEEFWQYGGEPYHFRLTVEGTWTPENESWTKKAVEKAKNVRSVLDGVRIGCSVKLAMMAEGTVLAKFGYPMTGGGMYAGTWPYTNHLGFADNVREAAEAEAEAKHFPYDLAGTYPQQNTLGVMDPTGKSAVNASLDDARYAYNMTGNDAIAGTHPRDNTLGVTGSALLGAKGSADGQKFPYTAAGTVPQENTISGGADTSIQAADADDSYSTIVYQLCGQDEI